MYDLSVLGDASLLELERRASESAVASVNAMFEFPLSDELGAVARDAIRMATALAAEVARRCRAEADMLLEGD